MSYSLNYSGSEVNALLDKTSDNSLIIKKIVISSDQVVDDDPLVIELTESQLSDITDSSINGIVVDATDLGIPFLPTPFFTTTREVEDEEVVAMVLNSTPEIDRESDQIVTRRIVIDCDSSHATFYDLERTPQHVISDIEITSDKISITID